jgi:hypothetical protein
MPVGESSVTPFYCKGVNRAIRPEPCSRAIWRSGQERIDRNAAARQQLRLDRVAALKLLFHAVRVILNVRIDPNTIGWNIGDPVFDNAGYGVDVGLHRLVILKRGMCTLDSRGWRGSHCTSRWEPQKLCLSTIYFKPELPSTRCPLVLPSTDVQISRTDP